MPLQSRLDQLARYSSLPGAEEVRALLGHFGILPVVLANTQTNHDFVITVIISDLLLWGIDVQYVKKNHVFFWERVLNPCEFAGSLGLFFSVCSYFADSL